MSAADEQEFFEAAELALDELHPCQNSELGEALKSMGVHPSDIGLPCKRQPTRPIVLAEEQFWLCGEHMHYFELAWKHWLNCPW